MRRQLELEIRVVEKPRTRGNFKKIDRHVRAGPPQAGVAACRRDAVLPHAAIAVYGPCFICLDTDKQRLARLCMMRSEPRQLFSPDSNVATSKRPRARLSDMAPEVVR